MTYRSIKSACRSNSTHKSAIVQFQALKGRGVSCRPQQLRRENEAVVQEKDLTKTCAKKAKRGRKNGRITRNLTSR